MGYDVNLNLIASDRFRPWKPIAWKPEMDHPLIYVSWNDAVSFCEWLSWKEETTYRLPTEAEWEYACRAGSDRRYHAGDAPERLVLFANVYDDDRKSLFPNLLISTFNKDGTRSDEPIPFPSLSHSDGYAWTAPVGRFLPNDFGLYDMHGNVGEWCSDWFDESYYASSPLDDPQGPTHGSTRVLRGGGYDSSPHSLRCAFRFATEPSSRSAGDGFRVVRIANSVRQ